MRKTFGLATIVLALTCGCTDETVRTEITSLRDIGKLAVYKVQNADLLTGKDNDVEVNYIAYTDAMICIDFSQVKIERVVHDNTVTYEVTFPDFTVEQARVIHDEKYSRPWSAKAKHGVSTTRVDKQLKIAAEKAIEADARKPEHMSRALEQAKSVVETMIRAGDKNAAFKYQ
jgi:hypothetical protein